MTASQPHFQSDFMQVMHERGFLYQATHLEELDAKAKAGPIVGYTGADPTANSLHVGHLMQVMALRWLQKTGNTPIALVGGGTTKVGDPTDRADSRGIMSDDEVAANMPGIRSIFERLLDIGPGKGIIVNNADWLEKLEYIPFLRDVGRHVSVNRMLSFDSVRTRLDREQPLTLLEFNYSVMQAYDFVELNRRFGCTLQMGGSDQWTNIVSGVDLGRKVTGAEMFAFTWELLTTASGQKMGKSAGNAVWVNADRTSPYEFYQYWRNVEDSSVVRLLKVFTDLPLDEIARLGALQGQEINEAKKVLALESTTLVHGRAAAEDAAETARSAFEEGALAGGLPTIEVDGIDIMGTTIADLAVLAGLAASKGEARRLIKQGGLTINGKRPAGELDVVDPKHVLGLVDRTIKIGVGKKRIVLVRVK